LPRPWTWQNSRFALLGASGRSHGLTSMPNVIRPSVPRGSFNAAIANCRPLISMAPQLKPSYRAP